MAEKGWWADKVEEFARGVAYAAGTSLVTLFAAFMALDGRYRALLPPYGDSSPGVLIGIGGVLVAALFMYCDLRRNRRPILWPRPKLRLEAIKEQARNPDEKNPLHVGTRLTFRKRGFWRHGAGVWFYADVWAQEAKAVDRLTFPKPDVREEWLASGFGAAPFPPTAPPREPVGREPKTLLLHIPNRLLFEWDDEGPTPDLTDEDGKPVHEYRPYPQSGFMRLHVAVDGGERILLFRFHADPADSTTISYDMDGHPSGESWDGDASSFKRVRWWNLKRLREFRALKTRLGGTEPPWRDA